MPRTRCTRPAPTARARRSWTPATSASRWSSTASPPAALAAFDAAFCGPISELVLRNRGAGPFGLLNLVDERCGGTFDDIDAVVPPDERNAFMAKYKAAAGFAKEQLNAAPPTIGPGDRVRSQIDA